MTNTFKALTALRGVVFDKKFSPSLALAANMERKDRNSGIFVAVKTQNQFYIKDENH